MSMGINSGSYCARLLMLCGVVVLIWLGWCSEAMAGSSIRLNHPMVDDEYIYDHVVSSNDDRVVYNVWGDAHTKGYPNYYGSLYSVPVYGGEPTLLTGDKPGNRPAFLYGSNLVTYDVPVFDYWNSEEDIYTVPADGGISVNMTNLSENQGASRPSIINYMGNQVFAYLNSVGNHNSTKICVVPLAGGESTAINAPLLPDEDYLRWYRKTPDNNYLIYYARNAVKDRYYYINLSNGVAAPLLENIDYSSVQILPGSGNQIIYTTNDGQLYNMNIDDQISVAFGNPDHNVGAKWISKDGHNLLYRQTITESDSSEYHLLYNAPINGGEPILLSNPGGTDIAIKNLKITDDSSHAIYSVRKPKHHSDSFFHLYSADLKGGGSTLLNPTTANDGEFASSRFWLHPDGDRVLFDNYDYNDEYDSSNMYCVDINGGPITSVIPQVDGYWQETVVESLTPNMDFVLFHKINTHGSENIYQLFAAPIDGGEAIKIGDPLPKGTNYHDISITSDSKTIIYRTKKRFYNYDPDIFSTGFPLAKIGAGFSVVGDVGGALGAPGRVDFEFESVVEGNTFSSVFYRLTAEERSEISLDDIEFLIPGDTMQLWDMGFAGEFEGPVTLILTYDESLLDEPYLEGALEIYHQTDTGTWELLPILARDITANTITVQTDSFSNFALGVPEPCVGMMMVLGAIVTTSRRRVA